MGVADFQNPLANMPIMQQMQQSQNQQAQTTPIFINQEVNQEEREQLTTVQDTKEQSEKDRINEEDEDRESRARNPQRKRAKSIKPDEEILADKPRVSDGVHGLHLDIQA